MTLRHLMGSAALVFMVATAAMLSGQELFATWYYSFAWWSYIVFAEAWLKTRGRGAVLTRSEAPRMLGLSVVIWVSFEVYNFRLQNWHYLDLPSSLLERWAGYSVAYATVMPGLFVTWKLLQTWFPPREGDKRQISSRVPILAFWCGLVTSLLPWVWPRFCFPLVWLGPTAFFAALNYWMGGEGLIRDVERQGPARLYRLVAAGGICGLLWELWNFWARSKWAYTVPFFDWLHLFEMPVAGFLGFLPFALECHEMYWFGRKILDRLRSRTVPLVAFWLLLACYVAAVYYGIDHFTVRSFQN